MTETYSDGDQIECPSCGGTITDLCDYDWFGGTEQIDVECGHCEKPFYLFRRVDVLYTARTAASKKDE